MALRAQFWAYQRPEGQGLEAFVNDLWTMASNCQYTDLETTLRDKLFFSIKDPAMKMKVMGDDGNASLEVVTQRMRTFESAKREHTLNSHTRGRDRRRYQGRGKQRVQSARASNHLQSGAAAQATQHMPNACSRCGTTHQPRNCPAYGKECRRCKKIKPLCRSMSSQNV